MGIKIIYAILYLSYASIRWSILYCWCFSQKSISLMSILWINSKYSISENLQDSMYLKNEKFPRREGKKWRESLKFLFHKNRFIQLHKNIHSNIENCSCIFFSLHRKSMNCMGSLCMCDVKILIFCVWIIVGQEKKNMFSWYLDLGLFFVKGREEDVKDSSKGTH